MKKNIKEIFKTSSQIRMTQDEKTLMKENLLSYARLNPASAIPEKTESFISFSYVRHHFVMAVIVIIVFVGGGTTALAERSLPGDLFYPLKTGISEQVRGWFAVSSEQKGEWEIALAERRLKELDSLYEKDEGFVEVREETENRANRHLSLAQELLNVSTESKKTKDSIESQAMLSLESAGADSNESFSATVSAKRIESDTDGDLSISSTLSRKDFDDEFKRIREDIEKAKKDLRSFRKTNLKDREFHEIYIQILVAQRNLIDSKVFYNQNNLDKVREKFEISREIIDRAHSMTSLDKNQTTEPIKPVENEENTIDDSYNREEEVKKEKDLEDISDDNSSIQEGKGSNSEEKSSSSNNSLEIEIKADTSIKLR